MAGTASGALSAAGRTLVAGTGAGTLQKEAHTLKEGEQHVGVLREKLEDLEKELEGTLRPRLRQCNEGATGSRRRCEDLREAITRLGEARAKAAEEVGGLSKRQLAEIRQLLRSPPEAVKRILAACWLLLHCQRFKDKPISAVRFDEKTDWPRCQRMLVDEGFIASVLSFDSKQLEEVPNVPACVAQNLGFSPPGVAPKARPSLRRSATVPVKPPLDLASVLRASEPCAPLLRWVQELINEHNERMKLSAELTDATAAKAQAESKEAEAEADLAEAEALLARLREALATQEAMLEKLEAEKGAAEKALQDIRRLDSLGTPGKSVQSVQSVESVQSPKASPKAKEMPKEKVPVPIELEVSGTLAVVEQKLAQCGVPFRRADAQVLEGDPRQALILPRIADIVKEHRGKLKLLLEGHQAEGEEPGTDIERSLAVYQWLVEVAGCAPGLLRLKGCGSTAGLGQLVVPVPIQELVFRSGPKAAEMENFPSGLYFAKDSIELLPETTELLPPLGKAFSQENYVVRLEGHVDKDENPDLAGQRAVRVRELLMELGVPRTKMRPQSCKALHPLSRTKHAVNRRVELHIL